jgi:hypothetical protein
MTQGDASGLREGLDILTTDGTRIGKVKHIAHQAFAVDAPLELDYWLPQSAIAQIQANDVLLKFAHGQLGIYKMASPDDIAGTTAAEDVDRSEP